MAHETLILNGTTQAFTHLELEIAFRAMIRAVADGGPRDLAPAAEAWREGLAHSDAGLVDVELEPHFAGPDGAERLAALIERARTFLPPDASAVPVAALNARLGTRIAPADGTIERRFVERGFDRLAALAMGRTASVA